MLQKYITEKWSNAYLVSSIKELLQISSIAFFISVFPFIPIWLNVSIRQIQIKDVNGVTIENVILDILWKQLTKMAYIPSNSNERCNHL